MDTEIVPQSPPLPVRESVTILRRRYPEALVCVQCAVLLATRRESGSRLTEAERLAYVCAECRLEAAAAARLRAVRVAQAAMAREAAAKAGRGHAGLSPEPALEGVAELGADKAFPGRVSITWRRARAYVKRAVRSGRLPNLRKVWTKCSHCPARATGYDHRDYDRPLDVAPVCHRCNAELGAGANKFTVMAPQRPEAQGHHGAKGGRPRKHASDREARAVASRAYRDRKRLRPAILLGAGRP